MSFSQTNTWTQSEEDVLLEDIATVVSELIVYNDDHNTFDWVIQSLVEICKHSVARSLQRESNCQDSTYLHSQTDERCTLRSRFECGH